MRRGTASAVIVLFWILVAIAVYYVQFADRYVKAIDIARDLFARVFQ